MEYKQNRVSALVWPWQESDAEAGDPHRKGHIIKGFVGLAIGLSVAAVLRFRYDHHTMPIVIVSISGVIAFLAFFVPAAFKKLDTVFGKLGSIVGQGIAYILLVPLFFLFFVPAHFFMSLKGTDKLKLKYPSDEKSFWEPREKIEDVSYYRRQY